MPLQVFPVGFSPKASKICFNRSTWCFDCSRCSVSAAFSSGECAAFTIFGIACSP